MRILFFDTECANCFDGIGKICELGYLVCDENFNVLEKDNMIINPAAEFDKKGFAMRKIKLSQQYAEYYKKEKFPAFYPRIREMFSANDVLVVGHGTQCDARYLLNECARYSLPVFDYRFIDTVTVVKKLYNRETRLKLIELYADFYPEKAHEQIHCGVDDAEMTAEVLKYVCRDKGLTVRDILKDTELVCDVYAGKIVDGNPFGYTPSEIMGKRNKRVFERCIAVNAVKCKRGKAFSFPAEYEHKSFPQMMKILYLMTERGYRYSVKPNKSVYVTQCPKEWRLKNANPSDTVTFEEFLKLFDTTPEALATEPIDVDAIIAELEGASEWYRGYSEYKKRFI